MGSIQLFVGKTVFAIRRGLDSYRFPLLAGLLAFLLFVAAIGFHLASGAALKVARHEAADLAKQGIPPAVSHAGALTGKPDLKAFRSSYLVAILEQGAGAANIKLDEISFAVDDAPNLPYLRYRASFQVVSRYPTIRKFISEILSGSDGVVLDTVACRREDINVADVRCEISAYVAYQETTGG